MLELSESDCRNLGRACRLFRRVDCLPSIGSTNDYLKDFVEAGEARLAVAREQTAGKGRYGRSWYSPAGAGLYLSYLCYPAWETERAAFLNVLASLVVVRAIVLSGGDRLRLAIKLPNDVYLAGRKVAGILTEMGSLEKRISWAIVGIGVNLYQAAFPEGLERTATSLHLEGVRLENPVGLLRCLTLEFERLFEQAQRGEWARIEAEHARLVL